MSHGHVVWCDHRTSGEPNLDHDHDAPFCYKALPSVDLIPGDGQSRGTLWATPTYAVTDRLQGVELRASEARYHGVEIAIETWDGSCHAQSFRMTSDAARTLAAILVRAADIQQGLYL